MTTRAALLAITLAACAISEPQLAAPSGAPTDVRADCALASRRCSRCHTLDRVVDARAEAPEFWRYYVHRMRLQPGSGIRPDEEPPILRCLVYRSFGPEGTASLDRSAP